MTTDLPDFEDMQRAIDRISSLTYRRSTLEFEIKEGESKVYRVASYDPKYFQQGKPLSISAIKSMYEFTGLDDELIPKRKELIQVEVDLDKERYLYKLMEVRIEVWRSEQANQRVSLSV